MKKIYLSIAIVFCATLVVNAQELFDALKFSDLTIAGTSRSISMGGAFGALGGDASSLITNPAGMGIYNLHEATITANNVYSQHTAGGDSPAKDSNDKITISQAAYIHSFKPVGKKYLLASNFGFAYHRLKNFQNSNTINGYQSNGSIMDEIGQRASGIPEGNMMSSDEYDPYSNTAIGWLPIMAYQTKVLQNIGGTWTRTLNSTMTPHYSAKESGSIDEFDVSYAANIANWFYIGGSLGIQTLEYSLTSSYCENFYNGEGYSINNSTVTKGTGWNFKIGAILRPSDWVRIGFAYHTPTFYSLKYYTSPNLRCLDERTTKEIEGSDSYSFRTAQHYLFSLGFVIKKKALIGIDYDLIDYRLMRYGDKKDTESFGTQNIQINTSAKLAHVVKLGFEYKPTEWIALRLGGGITTPTIAADATKIVPNNSINTSLEYFTDKGSYYATGGLGFRWSNWGIDLAYQFHQQGAKFSAYNGSNDINVTNYYHTVLITGSFRF